MRFTNSTKKFWEGYEILASIIAAIIFTLALYFIGLPSSVILYLIIMSGISVKKRSLLGLILVGVVAISVWWLLKGRYL